MKVPRVDYAYCSGCGGHRDAVGPLSRSRLCATCGQERLAENIEGLATRSGEPMQRWRLGMIKCAGGFTLDDLRSLVQGGDHA